MRRTRSRTTGRTEQTRRAGAGAGPGEKQASAAGIISGEEGEVLLPWDYPQALDFLSRFTDFERASTERVRYRDFNLQRVSALLALLGKPSPRDTGRSRRRHEGQREHGGHGGLGPSRGGPASWRLHVAAFAPCAGAYRRWGSPISEEEFARVVEAMAPAVEEVHRTTEFLLLTWFELLTAAAFCHFRTAGTGLAVVEVGLGGRLDATNVLVPTVCGITNISRDHVDLLGDTLQAIAGEKAAIIKPGVRVVSSAPARRGDGSYPPGRRGLRITRHAGWAGRDLGERDIRSRRADFSRRNPRRQL